VAGAAIVTLVVVLLGVGALLSLHTYNQVKGPLHDAQNTLTALAHNPSALNTAAGRHATELELAKASQEVTSAQNVIDSSAGLKILGVFPGLHTQRAGLDQLVADLNATTHAAAQLLVSVNTLAAESHGTTVSLADLRSLGSTLGVVRAELASEIRSVSGLWGPLGADRQKFDREDRRAVRLLGQGVDLTRYALPFLGSDGPRTYLVVGENNAEMRDQGSPLSYALMRTSGGTISVSGGSTIHDVALTSPAAGVTVPSATEAVFGGLNPTESWQNTNATADFPFSGADMQSMFAQATGTHVDGVIGLDVPALQGLLGLSGPVDVAGIAEPVTAQNAAHVLLDQLYADLPPNSTQGPRREELAAVAAKTVQELQSGKVDLVALARVLSTALGGRHIQVWDEVPSYEKTLNELHASGAIDTVTPDRAFHLAVENATASKLDYFVTVSLSAKVYVLKGGAAVIQTAVTVKNSAPGGLPPSYQLGPDGANAKVEGQYVGRVFLWGPRGSTQPGARLESGLSLNPEQDVSLLPGQSQTVAFQTTIPQVLRDGQLTLDYVPQPRLAPISLAVHVFGPGLHLHSKPLRVGQLSHTMALNWSF
jgi:hypothetical protein